MKPLAKLRYNPGRTKLGEIIEARVDPELYLATLEGVKTPEQELIDRQEWQRVGDCIDRLMPRAALALRLKYGIGCEPHTLDQVGERFGVSKERIRQIVVKGERTLQRWLLPKENWRALQDREAAEQRALRERREEENAAQASARAAQHRREWAEREAVERVAYARRAKENAERAYDWAYVEAHELNARWGDELKRRAEAERLRRAQAIKRKRNEALAERERRRIADAARLHRRAAKARTVERDWLLVGS